MLWLDAQILAGKPATLQKKGLPSATSGATEEMLAALKIRRAVYIRAMIITTMPARAASPRL